MPEKVISLDDCIRISRANTVRASYYQRTADDLPQLRAARLKIMEAKLFNGGAQAQICRPGFQAQHHAQFQCDEGTIWFSFSKDNRRFVLTEFDFAAGGGGGGGLPIPVDDPCGGVSPIRWLRERHTDQIAAKLDDVCRQAFGWAAQRQECGFEPKKRNRRSVGKAHSTERLAAYLHACTFVDAAVMKGFVGELAAIRPILLAVSDRKSRSLPMWSLLSRWISAPQQLENPYARAVLAGEVLCRIVSETRLEQRTPSILGFCDPWQDGDILSSGLSLSDVQESLYVLDHVGPQAFNIHQLDADVSSAVYERRWILEDERLTALARSELAFRICHTVTRHIYAAKLAAQQSEATDFDQAVTSKAMRKYALLTDFVISSGHLFVTEDSVLDADSVIQDYESLFGDRWAVLEATVRNMTAFEGSLRGLCRDMAAASHEPAAPDNPGLMRQHLINVAAELLDEAL